MKGTISPIKACSLSLARMLRLNKWYLLLGALYATTVILDPVFKGSFHIPCLFRSVFGFKCPGCGISRAAGALIQGDIAAAWTHNPLIFIVIPIILTALVYQWRSIYQQIVHANSVP